MRRVILLPLVLSLAFTLACYTAAGASLGLFLGTLVGITILVPPMSLREEALLPRLLALSATIDGAAIVWLLPMFRGPIGLGSFIACYLILTTYALALAGLAMVATRIVPAIVASAIAVLTGLAWLTWPIWLAEPMRSPSAQHIVGRLIEISPVFATNGVLKDLGIWSERSIAYRITNLNQHVPYALPASILPCMLFHGIVGAALLWLGSGMRWAFRSTTQIENSARIDKIT